LQNHEHGLSAHKNFQRQVDSLSNTIRKNVDTLVVIALHTLEETGKTQYQGLHRNVSVQIKLPGNWIDFLWDPENKNELFGVLASKVAKFARQSCVYDIS
jgi:hypothetical protein